MVHDPSPDDMGAWFSREIAPRVPHDALHLIGMNPVTGTVSFGFWHRYEREFARAEMLNCYLGDDPFRPTELARRPVPVAMLRADAGGDGADGGLRAREILKEHGMGCELRLALRDAHGVWGTLCLFREEGCPVFQPEEADRLRQLAPTLTAALRGYVRAGPWLPAGPPPPPGVILIGGDHTVRAVTAEARAWLRELPSEWLSSPEWAAAMLASEVSAAEPEAPGPQPMICVPAALAGRWVALQGQPLSGAGEVAVVVQAASGDVLLPIFAAWYGLTPRERDVVALLRTGRAPKQIAHRLGLSPYTVNDHLKSIFRKTRTSGRDELIAVLGG
ncbi:helix-turn-helix transcriptional regulator [Streptomyces sp. SAJ15]|uniref:helix-turn-helix transcriptional regulator n=1 Tax=Streptomyces sp. SAJ15 TaxID=2011095 RepID=UPI001185799C|nr:helix-turn-helix transcriptional regulator [Streptomyces sp. SAJ15]TVL92521.1 helix-turn-helix transcriptional regulator [Streptomyces sp. SAJ15]